MMRSLVGVLLVIGCGGSSKPAPTTARAEAAPSDESESPPEAEAASEKAPGCNAAALVDEGKTHASTGQHAAALAKFEAALVCEHDAAVVPLAFAQACLAQDSKQARHHYKQLELADQKKLSQICIKQKVAYESNCDSEALKVKGMEQINIGDHEAALVSFEQSLKCDDDVFVRQLAFMESCASGNSKKAKLYYKKLSDEAKDKFSQICKRQSPPVPFE